MKAKGLPHGGLLLRSIEVTSIVKIPTVEPVQHLLSKQNAMLFTQIGNEWVLGSRYVKILVLAPFRSTNGFIRFLSKLESHVRAGLKLTSRSKPREGARRWWCERCRCQAQV